MIWSSGQTSIETSYAFGAVFKHGRRVNEATPLVGEEAKYRPHTGILNFTGEEEARAYRFVMK